MSRLNRVLRGSLVVVALIAIATIGAFAVERASFGQADGESGIATMSSDFLTVSNGSVTEPEATPEATADQQSVEKLNDWTYTRRRRPSRGR